MSFPEHVKRRAYEIDPEAFVSYSGLDRDKKQRMDVRRMRALTQASTEFPQDSPIPTAELLLAECLPLVRNYGGQYADLPDRITSYLKAMEIERGRVTAYRNWSSPPVPGGGLQNIRRRPSD